MTHDPADPRASDYRDPAEPDHDSDPGPTAPHGLDTNPFATVTGRTGTGAPPSARNQLEEKNAAAYARRERSSPVQQTSPDDYDRDAVRQIYDDMAADYVIRFGAELQGPDAETEFLDAALADLPSGPVLDVGCGPAQVS